MPADRDAEERQDRENHAVERHRQRQDDQHGACQHADGQPEQIPPERRVGREPPGPGPQLRAEVQVSHLRDRQIGHADRDAEPLTGEAPGEAGQRADVQQAGQDGRGQAQAEARAAVRVVARQALERVRRE